MQRLGNTVAKLARGEKLSIKEISDMQTTLNSLHNIEGLSGKVSSSGSVSNLRAGNVYIDNTGIHIANDVVIINKDGIALEEGIATTNQIKWDFSGTTIGKIYAQTEPVTSQSTDMQIGVFAPSIEVDEDAYIQLTARGVESDTTERDVRFFVLSQPESAVYKHTFSYYDGVSLVGQHDIGLASVVFNEGSHDIDFRVETDGNEYTIFAEGSTNRVGILNATPSEALDVTGNIAVSGTVDGIDIAGYIDQDVSSGAGPAFTSAALTTPAIGVATGTSLDLGGTTLYASRAITVDTGGVLNIVLASAAGDDFTVDTDKLVVSGDTGDVGIGTATPTVALDVRGDIQASGLTGWNLADETWTYASATTFTVPTDLTVKYTKGTKLKLIQTSQKYFYVVGSSYSAPNTTVTVTGGTDYSLADAAVEWPFFSYAELAKGFPATFALTVGYTGFSADPVGTAKFSISGRYCRVIYDQAVLGTSDATGFAITGMPVTSSAAVIAVTLALCADNSSNITTPVRWDIDAGTTLTGYKDNNSATSWTAAGTKGVYHLDLSYIY